MLVVSSFFIFNFFYSFKTVKKKENRDNFQLLRCDASHCRKHCFKSVPLTAVSPDSRGTKKESRWSIHARL